MSSLRFPSSRVRMASRNASPSDAGVGPYTIAASMYWRQSASW